MPNADPAQKGNRRSRSLDRLAIAAMVVLLVLAAFYYAHRLMAWQAYDDEGGYLYAAWRIGLGEFPYRDFLTPQLPVFLYPGAWVISVFDYAASAARGYAIVLALMSAIILWTGAARLLGRWPATLALGLLLIEQEFFWAARYFRPEAPMLLFGMLGLYLVILGRRRKSRLWLAAAGASLGLAMMSKLFGALYMAGVGLWFLVDGARSRDWRRMFCEGLIVVAAFAVVVGGMGLFFTARAPNFVAAVLGHHLRQGSGTPPLLVVRKALALYRDFVMTRPVYAVLAVIGFVLAFCERDALLSLFACQLPTAAVFMLMTRGLQSRHFTYLVPSLAVCAALALCAVWRVVAMRKMTWSQVQAYGLVVVLVGLAAYPHWIRNAFVASWEEHDTENWAAYIQAHTGADQVVVADYPGLNYAARRPTTRLAAGISRGASLSGQIKGSDLIAEMEQVDVPMVLLNVAQGAHQFVNLVDYVDFKAYIQTRYYLDQRKRYDYRLMEVYTREDLWQGQVMQVNLGYQLALTGVELLPMGDTIPRQVDVRTRWQSLAPLPADYYVSLRLLDGQNREWGLGSKQLSDVDAGTYWDDEGLEQAILVPTSQWPVREATIETLQLPVDAGAPPGEYSALLRVHRKGEWTGLPVMGDDGVAHGYDVAIGHVVIPAPAAAADVDAYDMDVSLDLPLTPALTLLGRRAIVAQALPGDEVHLRFQWRWTSPEVSYYQIELGLYDAQETLVAINAPVLADGWSDQTLMDGHRQISVEAYDLLVPRDASSGSYTLKMLVTQDGVLRAASDLAMIEVVGYERVFEAPTTMSGHQLLLGENIALIGSQAELIVDDQGATVAELSLYWRSQALIDKSYTVFVHLINDSGQRLAQADQRPGAGAMPTTSWLENQVVEDNYRLRLPEGSAETGLRLLVGMYDPETGSRLPVADMGSGAALGDQIELVIEP